MQPQIFISYSWKNTDIADIIDKDWEIVGIKLIRDVRDLAYKQNIKDFMKRVNTSDYVLLIISKGYLESKNCMYEALEMFDNPSFKKKILPILTEDARIDKVEERLGYLQYWEEEIERINNKIKNLKSYANATAIYLELDHYSKIRASIDRFMDEISSILCIPWQKAKQASYQPIFEYIGFESNHVIERCIQISKIADSEEKDIALDELISDYPNNKNVLFAKAIIASDENQIRKARQTYERIIKLYPDYADAHMNLAILFMNNFQDYEQAKNHYEQALRIDPYFANAHYNLAILLTDHFQDYKLARTHYDQALQILPNDASAHMNLAALLVNYFKEYKSAKSHYEKALQIPPDNASTHYNLAILLADHFQDYGVARKHYERALEIKPNHDGAHSNLAALLTDHFQDYELAKKHFELAIQINPDAIAHFNLAVLLADPLEDYKLARNHYEKALQIQPDYASAHYNLAHLLANYFPEDHELARKHYERALEINPKLSEL